jgi:hypothetical protein
MLRAKVAARAPAPSKGDKAAEKNIRRATRSPLLLRVGMVKAL